MIQPLQDVALRKFHLWEALSDEAWQTLLSHMRQQTYAPGDVIFPDSESEGCLCLLWSGDARVYARTADSSHTALLRTMRPGALFGVHCIFNADMAPQSTIVAHSHCSVLLIPGAVWEEILVSHPETMKRYLRFLTQRIEFLNQKIQYLTAGCAERRLSLYLISQIPEDEVATRLDISAVSLADLLDLGRASLYRAMDRLSADGFLTRDGHIYTLHHREQLLTHYS